MAQQAQATETPIPNPAEAYEQFLVPAMFTPWAPELLNRVAPNPGETTLDLACGTGAVTRQLAPLLGPTATLIGYDISPAMLAVARSLPPPPGAVITWREGAAEGLPFPDASFRLICCQQGLQFSPDRPAVAREMHRVLAPGGRVGISVWHGIEHQPVIAALDRIAERYTGAEPDDTPFSLGSAAELRGLLADAGFQRITVEAVTRPVHFPSRATWVRQTILAAAAVMPDEIMLTGQAREDLIDAMARDLEHTLLTYQAGDGVTFPMTANIAVASR